MELDILMMKCALYRDAINVVSSDDLTYSAAARALKKDKDLLLLFRKTYKEVFDKAVINDDKDVEAKALAAAVDAVSDKDNEILKNASPIPMGDPEAAGKSIADLIKFLMQKISEDSRPKSIQNLKRKIVSLNENELAAKDSPNSSAIGHAITLSKFMLFSHSPQYIRSVLNAIANSL